MAAVQNYWGNKMNQMVARLESHRHTAADERWPGAIWPSDKAFDAARSFIECLPEGLSAVADIGLADDGEINFLWNTESVHVDLGFHDEGSYSCFARDGAGREFLEHVLAGEVRAAWSE